jgi:hypothetical protein
MATTFNPLDFNRADFNTALGGGRDYAAKQGAIDSDIASLKTSMTDATATINSILNDVQQHKASNVTSFNKVDDDFSSVKDILEQIIYKGSNNQIDLSGATLSFSPSGIDDYLSIDNGVITFIKPAASETDWEITVSGFTLATGGYYKCTGDDIPSDAGEVVDMQFWDGPKGSPSDWLGVSVKNTDDMSGFYYEVENAVSNGDIVITIDKDYVTNVWRHLVPTFAKELYDKEWSLPKFSPLSGV